MKVYVVNIFEQENADVHAGNKATANNQQLLYVPIQHAWWEVTATKSIENMYQEKTTIMKINQAMITQSPLMKPYFKRWIIGIFEQQCKQSCGNRGDLLALRNS